MSGSQSSYSDLSPSRLPCTTPIYHLIKLTILTCALLLSCRLCSLTIAPVFMAIYHHSVSSSPYARLYSYRTPWQYTAKLWYGTCLLATSYAKCISRSSSMERNMFVLSYPRFVTSVSSVLALHNSQGVITYVVNSKE